MPRRHTMLEAKLGDEREILSQTAAQDCAEHFLLLPAMSHSPRKLHAKPMIEPGLLIRKNTERSAACRVTQTWEAAYQADDRSRAPDP